MIFGMIIVVISGVVLWKWWNSTNNSSIGTFDSANSTKSSEQNTINDTNTTDISKNSLPVSLPPPMLFAVNDNGNLDLTDFNNKLLDSSYSSNPKVYLNLLAMATKDVTESSTDEGIPSFSSNVGSTKSYEIGGDKFIINYTRLV